MRPMRLLVFFDLPTGNRVERRSYTDFHKFLLKDGWNMEQFSVYTRALPTREGAKSHIGRMRANLPAAGAVTVIMLTEKQFAEREVLVETRTKHVMDSGPASQMTLFF